MGASEPELVRARRLVSSHTLAAETAADVVALARDGNAFAAELYRVLCFVPGNLLFSPFSISRDHPFLFFLRHQATGALLFVGRVVDPS